MNIKVLDSWLREYLETNATPQQLKECLSLCGPSVEKVEKSGDDFIYDIEITTNRIDTVSVYGIAREAAAILPRFGIQAKLKEFKINIPQKAVKVYPLEVIDKKSNCNRLMGIVMEVDKMKPSPEYVKNRLEKSGVRSLNNLVDITNYVMLELGHPCHVFDYDRIKTHKLILRPARKNEPIITLDNKKYLLTDEDIIIDDGTGKVIDLPGIMGTENSVVTNETKKIIFFIESNNPTVIRRTAMHYGIRTMAASINEKHPDPELVKTAFFAGIKLFEKIAGGKISGELIDIYPKPSKPKNIQVSVEFISKRIGVELKANEIIDILKSLLFEVKLSENSLLSVTPPTFRQFDITIPEDIVEEVARIYGYHNLPSSLMTGKIPISDKPKDLPLESKIKTALKYFGFTEIYNYSLISKTIIGKANLSTSNHLHLSNPLTEEIEFMRISLIPSMLNSLSLNQHYSSNISLFELANVYKPQINNLPEEISMLVVAGSQSFSKMKGILEAIFTDLGVTDFKINTKNNEFFHPGKSVNYEINGEIIATAGNVNPKLQENFTINFEIMLFELNLRKLLKYINPIKKYIPLPLYPPVIEDLTLNISSKTKIGDIIKCIYNTSHIVNKVEFTGIYQNKASFKIIYIDPSKNLDSIEVAKIRGQINQILQKELGIAS